MPDLRTLRHRHGLTIFEVAQLSGLQARTIAELEFGMRVPNTTERQILAHIYALAPEDLLAPNTRPAVRPRPNRRSRLSRHMILVALGASLVFAMLFGDAIYGAETQAPIASASLVAHQFGRPAGPSSPSALATTLPTPAATPEPVPTIEPGFVPTERPNPTATGVPSPAPSDALSSIPTQAPSPAPTPPSPQSAAVVQQNSVFMPLPADGPFHQNVVAALQANNAALEQISIPPDGTWSFNRSIGNPDVLQLASVYGVYGGGWCDLASRYTMLLRPLLPPESFAFIRHIDSTGFGLNGVPDGDAVVIWNSNGGSDEQDLRIHNTSGQTIHIRVTLAADGVHFQATLGGPDGSVRPGGGMSFMPPTTI